MVAMKQMVAPPPPRVETDAHPRVINTDITVRLNPAYMIRTSTSNNEQYQNPRVEEEAEIYILQNRGILCALL